MGADVSRVRFDPVRDLAGVVMQQGRVLLDGDWNELVAIVERRLRAGAADLGSTGPVPGIAGTAVVPATTPDGFRLDATAGAITIGRGRMYVDGLLAENHGTGPAELDAVLAEPRRQNATPYLQQPYWPTPAVLPATGTHLAYLDVWSREVTHLEDPGLVEPAVGVDTTARSQTVWQVRVHLPATPGLTCTTPDADIPGWLDVIRPSDGRLTTDTVPVAPDDDPCELPPTGGYRGLENQTYRVEVHTGGPAGTATFKWATENASVASPVLEVMAANRVRPASLGRDDVLSFKTGDWVEILDDHYELDRRPGVMRKITVDADAGTMTLHAALPADLQLTLAQAAERHLRVRRWSQKGQIKSAAGADLDNLDASGSPGVIQVPAAAVAIVLEHGVTVVLQAPGGRFRPGDHWVFAARTNDNSVEQLVEAPPLGVHHHYARLAVVTFPGTEIDCRTAWPPPAGEGGCGDCSVCVTPESHASGALTIQDAVDLVVPTGGTVCLAVGLYALRDRGVRITGANGLRLHGQGSRTVLLASADAVHVEGSAFVTLEDFAVVSASGQPAIRLDGSLAATVQRLEVLAAGAAPTPGADQTPAVGVELSGVVLRALVRENVVVAPVGIAAGPDGALLGALDVAGNILVCNGAGVSLGGTVAHVLGNTVRDNTVLVPGEVGIRATGRVGPGSSLTVESNAALVGGQGIEVGPTGAIVRNNVVTGLPGSELKPSDGIRVSTGLGDGSGTVWISGNEVRDIGGAGISVTVPVRDLAARDNLVERARAGIVMGEQGRAETAAFTANVVRDIGRRATDNPAGTAGIQVVGVGRAEVGSNDVSGVGIAPNADDSSGIRVLAADDLRITHNTVTLVGPVQHKSLLRGIEVAGPVGQALVQGNTSRRRVGPIDEGPRVPWTGLSIGDRPNEGEPQEKASGDYVTVVTRRTFLIGRRVAFVEEAKPTLVTVDANNLTGGGEAPAALVASTTEAVVTGNQFQQRDDSRAAALELHAGTAIVSANRGRGGKPTMVLDVPVNRLAVLGNLTTNGINVPGPGLGPPWAALNPSGI